MENKRNGAAKRNHPHPEIPLQAIYAADNMVIEQGMLCNSNRYFISERYEG
jgi:hypothetical protein